MTIACKPNERWEKGEGAPPGPSFDLTIPSSRNGRGPYRVVRDQVTGAVFHMPPCEAWEFGNRNCRHVQEGRKRSEEPANAFMDAVQALRESGEWFADVRGFAVAVLRAHDEAKDARAGILKLWEQEHREPVTLDESVEAFR